ncbi:hypothetical protein [Dyadobacter sp. CY312]|uniref:hypothetical protein n=1 Tax=Dyadobacter sp. CY312 TaxID=2907303 RepID=UPI001F4430EB|nr:hypothetical protein [Dyadobacter sp. CY312]MCE7040770.1 hypothetical protein [Dyadobacter sp. CY312]
MKKLLLILLVYSFPLFLSALTGCDDCNPDPIRFGISNYKIYLGNAEKEDQYMYPPDTIAANDTVDFKKLSIAITGTLRSVVFHSQTKTGAEAWACDPAVIAIDKIKSIIVTSSASYNSTLPPGTHLSPVLSIARERWPQQAFFNFDTTPDRPAYYAYSIRLTQAPESSGLHRFTVKIDLLNGQSFTSTSAPVYIKK